MPDITMCMGGKCPMKDDCYRHTAKPHEYRQSYFGKPPFTEEVSVGSQRIFPICEYFSDNAGYK